ncbi:MAG: heparinase II/III-family protein [Proteobacteria bacterium]|nr:heparinase II/III-family protein [Pseudomonadota bacterium]
MAGSADNRGPIGPDTLGRERAVLVARLRTEPLFVLRQLPSLASAVYRRIRTRIALRLAAPHRGAKIQPAWLASAATGPWPRSAPAAGGFVLPLYPAPPHGFESMAQQPAQPVRIASTTDPEDQFGKHRWGFLLEELLAGRRDPDRAVADCLDWVRANTDRAARAWEPYSCCERVANLIVFLAVASSPTQQPPALPELRAFVDNSLAWVYRHLEYYGPGRTNNHILNNARALVIGGVASGNRAAAAAGMQIFRVCLPELIAEGGFLRERSSHYQLIVLNWLLDAWRFVTEGEGRGGPDGTFLRGYIERMVVAAAMLCARSERLLATVGDVSPDVAPDRCLARLLCLYPDFWPLSPPAALPEWRPRDGWFRLEQAGSIVLGNFPAGVFPLGFPTHGHADATSFVWLHEGRQILTDAGRWRYTADPVSLFQKSAAGHNVPVVNGSAPLCETLVPNGEWWPVPHAAARLCLLADSASVEMSHDGFARATPVRRHSRRIENGAHDLSVVDSFEGEGDADIVFCWHFGAGLDSYDEQSMVVTGRGCRVQLQVDGFPDAPATEVAFGGDVDGWSSPTYGEKQPALALYLRWRSRLPVRVRTRFTLTTSPQTP